jgi:hypothetical protein
MKNLFLVFWPSFMIAGIAEIAFFALVDPQELYLLGHAVRFSALATYSIGFFAFWAICAASSYATCFFQRSGRDINEETIQHTAPPA